MGTGRSRREGGRAWRVASAIAGPAWRSAARLALVAAIALALGHAAGAAELTRDQRWTLLVALQPDGFLNADMHRAFWAALPAEIRNDPGKVRALVEAEQGPTLAAVRLSRAEWESAKASKAAGRVVETPDYVAEKEAMFEHAAAHQEFAESAADIAVLSRSLLEAAASGQPIHMGEQEEVVTSELIETRLSGTQTALFRLDRLLDPSWSVEPKDYDYPEARLRIRWEGPFLKDTKAGPVFLTYRYSEEEVVQIILLGVPDWHLDESSVGDALKTMAGRLGVQGGAPQVGAWRGRATAELSGPSPDGYTSLRVVAAPEFQAAYFLWATAPDSAAADDLRARVEEAIALE
jgi:hypothetical protein